VREAPHAPQHAQELVFCKVQTPHAQPLLRASSASLSAASALATRFIACAASRASLASRAADWAASASCSWIAPKHSAAATRSTYHRDDDDTAAAEDDEGGAFLGIDGGGFDDDDDDDGGTEEEDADSEVAPEEPDAVFMAAGLPLTDDDEGTRRRWRKASSLNLSSSSWISTSDKDGDDFFTSFVFASAANAPDGVVMLFALAVALFAVARRASRFSVGAVGNAAPPSPTATARAASAAANFGVVAVLRRGR